MGIIRYKYKDGDGVIEYIDEAQKEREIRKLLVSYEDVEIDVDDAVCEDSNSSPNTLEYTPVKVGVETPDKTKISGSGDYAKLLMACALFTAALSLVDEEFSRMPLGTLIGYAGAMFVVSAVFMKYRSKMAGWIAYMIQVFLILSDVVFQY